MSKRWGHVISNEGEEAYHSITLDFKTTNNKAEYEALLAGLAIMRALNMT